MAIIAEPTMPADTKNIQFELFFELKNDHSTDFSGLENLPYDVVFGVVIRGHTRQRAYHPDTDVPKGIVTETVAGE
jgi:hypothetical protein